MIILATLLAPHSTRALDFETRWGDPLLKRNWLQLYRKLVDVTDLDASFNAVQTFMNQNNAAFYGEGVLSTTQYPNPFPISVDAGDLSGLVGYGIGYDSTGMQVAVNDTNGVFTITPGDANFDRHDLLVIRYLATGQTLIPEPSLPTQNIYLNVVDGYQIAVIAGTPAAQPTYPAKGQYDIILAGLIVPRGTSTGMSVVIDSSIREIALRLRSFFPTFVQETPVGVTDGTNQTFTLSQVPLNAQSVLVTVDGTALSSAEYSLNGQVITLLNVPDPNQNIYAWYVKNAAGSINPVSAIQESPSGTVDGVNDTFTLSGRPVNQASLQVYINGLLEPATNWSLVQGVAVSQIKFFVQSIPQPGQNVYAFYLQNVSTQPIVQTQTSGGGVNGSLAIQTEYPQLQSGDIQNGYITLLHTPAMPQEVLLDVIGAGAQAYGIDFLVSGNKLQWLGELVTDLVANDVLRINYQY